MATEIMFASAFNFPFEGNHKWIEAARAAIQEAQLGEMHEGNDMPGAAYRDCVFQNEQYRAFFVDARPQDDLAYEESPLPEGLYSGYVQVTDATSGEELFLIVLRAESDRKLS